MTTSLKQRCRGTNCPRIREFHDVAVLLGIEQAGERAGTGQTNPLYGLHLRGDLLKLTQPEATVLTRVEEVPLADYSQHDGLNKPQFAGYGANLSGLLH